MDLALPCVPDCRQKQGCVHGRVLWLGLCSTGALVPAVLENLSLSL